jgi:quinol monooxygenase YgiN
MEKSGASDRFIIAREDDDPDVLWNIEVFRSEQAKADYENSPLADELRDEIIGLLVEPPMRVAVHPYSALPADES